MKKHENLILILLVVALVAFPLIWKAGSEFGGADDQVKDVVAEINPEYKPWFEAIWSPPSTEVESFLFALQAAAGVHAQLAGTPEAAAALDAVLLSTTRLVELRTSEPHDLDRPT